MKYKFDLFTKINNKKIINKFIDIYWWNMIVKNNKKNKQKLIIS